MNRRIRKKRRVGEFNWKGFEFTVTFDPPLEDVDAFFDKLVEFVEANSLMIGGGFDEKQMEQFVTKSFRGRRLSAGRYRWRDAHCTDQDRMLVADYFHQFKETDTLTVGPLMGAWS